ncbi:MAG TPA: glycosyltransferase [Thiobacillaceae bacterium]|nr:glycosyltransferase [Thiobacillaceae bacterium]
MSGADKTLLVVAGEFPPLKTIGRIRTVKFVDHLRQHGWHSIVLTLDPTGREPNYDPSLLDEIPEGTEVVRLPMVDLEESIARAAKSLLGHPVTSPQDHPLLPGGRAGERATPPANRKPVHQTPGGSPWLDRAHDLTRQLLKNYVYIPDNYRAWANAALKQARHIVATRPIDAIYTTLPPFSSAWVGYHLRGETGIPWLVDYRDLWYGDVLREWLPKWRQQLELRMERRLLKRADAIITVSEPKTAYMRKLHPELKARWETLTNGYDTDIYAGRQRTRPRDDGRIEFVFTGRLFKNRRGHPFAEALGRIARRAPELVKPVRVRILGGVSPEIRARYDAILQDYGINDHFEFPGDVSYNEAMDAQVNCDYLLLIVDTGETSDGVIPGKLFEYVAARRPIFALCDPGVTQQIIERAKIGVVVPAEDVEACEDALEQLLTSRSTQEATGDRDYLSQFDRKQISRRFSDFLEDICSTAITRPNVKTV